MAKMRLKWVIAVQAVIILILAGGLWHQYSLQSKNIQSNPNQGLLSSRVYAGILEPKSYLILNFVPLKKELQKYISSNNLTMSVYVVNMRDGASMSIGSYRPFEPASLSKVPIAILTMKKVEEGKLTLDTLIEIQESDKINASGTLYQTTGKALPLRVLLQEMLQNSDNTAFMTLLKYLGDKDQEIINTYWDYFSTDTTPEPEQVYQEGLVTARSIYNVFLSLYLSTVLEPEHSEYILSLLTDTVFDVKKIAQLPSEVEVSHKYGVREDGKVKVFHDCGIMYIEEMRIFYCVMTSGMERTKAVPHLAYAVHEIHNFVTKTRTILDDFKKAS